MNIGLARQAQSADNVNMSIETPCIAVCFIDPTSKLCLGCGRTLPEIARWPRMTSAERLQTMASLEDRMDAAGIERIPPNPKASSPTA